MKVTQHHAMQPRGGWCSNPCPVRCTSRNISDTNCTEGWLEPKAVREGKKEKKFSCSTLYRKPTFQPLSSRYINYAIPAPNGEIPARISPKKCSISPDKFLIILRQPRRNATWKFSKGFCPHILDRTLFGA
jgi:hypothetical protein